MNKKVIYYLVFLAVLLGATGFWLWQKNSFSRETLKLEILGPSSVDFAKEFEYTVKYKNNGSVRLEEPRLVFEYPKHSILEIGQNARQEVILEDIYPGEEKTMNFKARILGKESEVLTAKASLSYKPKNLKARYESDTTFTTQIASLPLSFEFDLSSQVESGKSFKFRINYFSNVDYPLSDLRVSAVYPLGFEFIGSSPASLEKKEWEIASLNKANGGRIEISGNLTGNIGEQKIFAANIGIWRDGEFILLKEINKGVEMTSPSLRITQQINGDLDYAISPGEMLHYEIFFKNVGEESLSDLSLAASLTGDVFDFTSINAPEGNFATGDSSIVWDWKRAPALLFLSSQEEGKVEFWIKTKADFEIKNLNGNLVAQSKIYLGPAREEFLTKVNSKMEIIQKGFFNDEIFGNSGPVPPKAGQPTTYTIIWQVKNYYNSVTNAKVKAILPQNVQLTGKIFPEGSRLTFDSQSREIVWEIGDLQVGEGVLNSAPNISFQIIFVPTAIQSGQTPDIIGQAKITGEDSWTRKIINGSDSAINTSLPDDQGTNLQGTVQF